MAANTGVFGLPRGDWNSEPRSFLAYHANNSEEGGGYATFNMAVANRAVYYRILRGNTVATRFRMYIGTSAGNVDIGIYRGLATAENPVGAVRLGSTGPVACPGAGSAVLSVAPTPVAWPTDWLAVAADGTTATCLSAESSIGSSSYNVSMGLQYYTADQFPLPACGSITTFANWSAAKITCTMT